MKLNTTEEIIEDIRNGKMVIIMDDEDRENEGDLLMAATATRAEDINFMARYGRGLICLTLTRERCQQLRLPLMVGGTDTMQSTNFTLSIEATRGVTTGISAADRAVTVQAAVKPDARPEDIVQPGHIFPLMAQPGGVLSRAGHTEAGCDLARLAGLDPSSVIVEILNEDGSMARRPDLEKFAEQHKLKIGTIEDLISYRLKNEKTVERVAECDFPTDYGKFRLLAFQNVLDGAMHFALVRGEIDSAKPVTVRVHMVDILSDILHSSHTHGWPLSDAISKVAQADQGVIVILRKANEEKDILQWMSRRPVAVSEDSAHPSEWRTDGVGAQILMDIGVKQMRLMTAPKVYHGLAGFGLEIVEYLSGDSE
ncbi:MAG: bifunctional 3,4-dihydroxy-2-butanone-4-phosphate synthase/GTP cyclohydrolase II [Gammaproteobacteria bacterium]